MLIFFQVELPATQIHVILFHLKCLMATNIAAILNNLSSQMRQTLSRISLNYRQKNVPKFTKALQIPRKLMKIIQTEKSLMITKKTRLMRSRIRFEQANSSKKKSLFSCTHTIRLINPFFFHSMQRKFFCLYFYFILSLNFTRKKIIH